MLDALGHGLLIRGLQIGMLVDREISRETRRGPGTTLRLFLVVRFGKHGGRGLIGVPTQQSGIVGGTGEGGDVIVVTITHQRGLVGVPGIELQLLLTTLLALPAVGSMGGHPAAETRTGNQVGAETGEHGEQGDPSPDGEDVGEQV